MSGIWDDLINVGVTLVGNKIKGSMSNETRQAIEESYNNKKESIQKELERAKRYAKQMSDEQLRYAAKNESSSIAQSAYLEELKRRKESKNA